MADLHETLDNGVTSRKIKHSDKDKYRLSLGGSYGVAVESELSRCLDDCSLALNIAVHLLVLCHSP